MVRTSIRSELKKLRDMEKQGGSEAPSMKTESYTYTASSFRQLTYESKYILS